MFTRQLTRQPITVLDEEAQDSSSINRLLAAAAISTRFRACLLSDPQQAIRAGFGGESFPFSQSTQHVLVSIKASSLPDFARQLEAKLRIRF